MVNGRLAGLGVEFLAGDGTSLFRVGEERAEDAGFGTLVAPWLDIVYPSDTMMVKRGAGLVSNATGWN